MTIVKKHKISSTLGKKCVTNGINNKYLYEKDIEEFLLNNKDWYPGNCFKGKPSLNSTGRAKTEEDEILRKIKISETMKKNPLAGGKRHGSGRGRKGWYKGIFCDSSWELAFVVYNIDNNIDISRCTEKRKYIYQNEEHIYIPDFCVNNEIIEIKGYKTKQWEEKLKYNPDVKVLYCNDIDFYVKYCEEKYGKNWINELYNKKEM